MNFCAVFKDLRKESGLSALKLATILGYSKNIIYEWEKGRSEPNFETLCKIAYTFNVSVDYLVGNSDEFGNVSAAPMHDTLSKDEKDLLSAFNRLSVFERDSILVQIKALAEKNKSVIKK